MIAAEVQQAPEPRPVWDLVLTIVLLLVQGLFVLAAFFLSFLFTFAGDSCSAVVRCDYTRMTVGMYLAQLGPFAVGALALAGAIVLLVRRRLAWWVPVVGIVVIIAVYLGGAAITTSGVPGFWF